MRVLGIETSCDETGVAVYDSEQGLLGHALYSQIELHAQYGGVVPELASRDHVRKLIPLLKTLLNHLLAAMLEAPAPTFPFLALLVSGGHTQLVQVAAVGKYTVLGESVDDAAGEAFDKTAKLLGLGYPGGPALARLAERGNPKAFHFPRKMNKLAPILLAPLRTQ